MLPDPAGFDFCHTKKQAKAGDDISGDGVLDLQDGLVFTNAGLLYLAGLTISMFHPVKSDDFIKTGNAISGKIRP
jgi:transcription termination factor Rho